MQVKWKPGKTLVTGMLVGGLILSGSLALADTNTTSDKAAAATTQQKGPGDCGHRGFGGPGGRGGFAGLFNDESTSTVLDQLVTNGTLTSSQVEKLQTFFKEQEAARQAQFDKLKNMTEAQKKAAFAKQNNKDKIQPVDLLTQAVNKGIISNDEATAIRDAQQASREKEQQKMMEESLDNLVTDKTITQDQADKILTYCQTQQETRQTEMEKIKTMTDAERKTYMETQRSKKQDPLASLVNDNVLTQSQADAVAKVLFQGGGHFRG